ncbi:MULTISPECIES: PAS domain S-box protein [unclassified Paenibacillus]|uniref:PAS domain S-box protein n=1 Tax=unclassified Paenibacillus TaxID=185978 RepID=UPI0024053A26|nr:MULTISPECIES: PAS domain S-box protein [unclassified Paenibacillus]MDF9842299.1 PAS domain S-box-containing protein [Paenibacillus sp. PastF-2]MDF9848824.1 PAS domain S-box-containing protein [Paenibacillus sp. PastM-2]MDF9855394.1 PAS domain S-box-containing protein [Paenibacillus sp. PastF-1]MDH6480730.1 PAS domain S-box-containing protein [Paenibacillus sp. PastH-2]MDH6508089.1 PAS domain S-box-containing protein [Paenibacillus sp. PastM-3]
MDTQTIIDDLHREGIVYSSLEEEMRRLEELYDLGILDTEPEERFDRITKLVGGIFRVPICLITLVTEKEQWFKSCFGLEGELLDLRRTEREASFCQHVIAKRNMLIVEDTAKDPLFRGNRLVLDHGIGFYAGAPLETKAGNILGSLCLIDSAPRRFSEEEADLLQQFSGWIMTELELRRELRQKMIQELHLKELVASNAWLMKALEHSSAGVVITDATDPDLPIIYANPGFTKLTGYAREEIIGHNCRFLQGPDTDAAALVKVRSGIREQAMTRVELLNYRKDGTSFWNELLINPVDNEQGDAIHFVGIQNDISSRKAAEQALENAFYEQDHLLQSLPDIIYALDLQGRLLKMNEQLCRLTEQTMAELKGTPIQSLMINEDRALFSEALINGLHHEKTELETSLSARNGLRIPFQWSVVLLRDEDGRPIGYAGVGKDISERVQMRKDIMHAGRLQDQLLPKELDHPAFRIRNLYQPSQYVSGDFYYYEWEETEGKLQVYLMDVMGHGFATALNCSALRLMLQQMSRSGLRPAQKLARMNHECLQLFPEGYFTTGLFAEIDIAAKTLTYASGGINKLILYRNGKPELKKAPGGLVGIIKQMTYDDVTLPFEAGDRLLLVTDGISDMIKDVETWQDDSIDAVIARLQGIIQTNPGKDDATAVCVELIRQAGADGLEPLNDSETHRWEWLLPSKNTSADELRPELQALFLSLRLPKPNQLLFAVNEAVINAAEATMRKFGENEEAPPVQVTVQAEAGRIIVDIANEADPIDPLYFTRSVDELEAMLWDDCGRGILLMRKMTDEISCRVNGTGRNIMTLITYREKAQHG